jgi:putative peptide zinc metalloprotease protein
LVIALVGGVFWVGFPVFALVKCFCVGTDTESPDRARFLAASSLTVVLLSAFFFLCPGPTVISAPVVIDYDPLSIIRAKADGFVRQIHVRNGDFVQPGQVLVTLDNPELVAELDSLLIDIRISRLRADSLLAMGDVASLKLEQESLRGMEDRRDELTRLVSYLNVRADQAGVVLARNLPAIEQTWFKPGQEILSIGLPEDIHAIALARQEDVDWIENSQVREVELRIWGRGVSDTIDASIVHINPRARDDLAHEAFAAVAGGPLAVVPRNHVESVDSQSEEDSMMLVEPRVPLKIELPIEERQALATGQTGVMKIRSRNQFMGAYLVSNFTRFIRKNTFMNHGL